MSMDIAELSFFKEKTKETFHPATSTALLQKRLVQFSFFNLFLVSLLGLLLRSFPFLPSFPLQYKNLLHSHSHFAFGGWVMPILLALLLKIFPQVTESVASKHWRNITVLIVVAAYGMLFSFPFQGYGPVSIFFSTISVIAGYYVAVVIWKATRHRSDAATKFLRAGLFYLTLSSIGPFATGPIMATGMAGTPLYYNAIYFYLHFQYNGWFVFALMAILYKMLEGKEHNGNKAFILFNIACAPAYFLSILWNHPGILFNIVGGIAALLQVAGLVFVVKDAMLLKWRNGFVRWVFALSIIAFIIKNVLQAGNAFPAVAHMAYVYRNFVIAYLHLVLLGFVSMFSLAVVFQKNVAAVTTVAKWGCIIFLLAFVTTELLLVANAAENFTGLIIPSFPKWIWLFSCLFPIAFFSLWNGIRKQIIRT